MINRPIQSRIDRIYLEESLLAYSWDWKIDHSGINTDHAMISMTLLNPWQPYIGKGRYAMPVHLLKDDELIDRIEKLGIEHQKRLDMCKESRTEWENPQRLHKSFKDKIIEIIRQRSKETKPKILRDINALKSNRKEILNNTQLGEDLRREEAAILDERIKNLEMLRFARARDTVATSFFLYGETVTKP